MPAENSDLLMRALQSHALKLEEELQQARGSVEYWKSSVLVIALKLWPDMKDSDMEVNLTPQAIIEELKRRGVLNGGGKA